MEAGGLSRARIMAKQPANLGGHVAGVTDEAGTRTTQPVSTRSSLARSCRAQADSWARLARIPLGAEVDALVLNGWAAVLGGVLLLVVSAVSEDWSSASWTAGAVGSIVYLAAIGTAVAFVTLTRLLRELPAVTMSFIALLLPFGALVSGAVVYGEPLTAAELGGAALVAAGIFVAQWPGAAALRARRRTVASSRAGAG